eukprot:1194279-Prorocentrum_minimum.AAC.8
MEHQRREPRQKRIGRFYEQTCAPWYQPFIKPRKVRLFARLLVRTEIGDRTLVFFKGVRLRYSSLCRLGRAAHLLECGVIKADVLGEDGLEHLAVARGQRVRCLRPHNRLRPQRRQRGEGVARRQQPLQRLRVRRLAGHGLGPCTQPHSQSVSQTCAGSPGTAWVRVHNRTVSQSVRQSVSQPVSVQSVRWLAGHGLGPCTQPYSQSVSHAPARRARPGSVYTTVQSVSQSDSQLVSQSVYSQCAGSPGTACVRVHDRTVSQSVSLSVSVQSVRRLAGHGLLTQPLSQSVR